ncbi:MAG: hypothetical protein JMM76_02460 [Candidatus Xiphinematobacter sp.]|nr:MAG: hypothetical protein JMM76_02460 [Candidatus Xiphinematobacter sp.]QQY11078.1 MAG: hypothetical protein JMM77_02505 [Candidatus Xiphinematobacter sp.]
MSAILQLAGVADRSIPSYARGGKVNATLCAPHHSNGSELEYHLQSRCDPIASIFESKEHPGNRPHWGNLWADHR